MESHLENNKYYVPEISEFHVGFEYEHLTGFEKEFKPWIYDLASACTIIERESISHNGEIIKMFIPAIQACVEEKQCRVKYLDRSNIESLGWKEETYNTIKGFIKNNKFLIVNYNYKTKPIVDISYFPIFKNQGLSRIFRGTIKNKSELIKLMQQLNINKTWNYLKT